MQNGDLSVWAPPRVVFVLEGTLADITEQRTGHFRRKKTRSYHWLPTPIKRLAYLAQHWPETVIEVVTFMSWEVADEAAEFFVATHIPVSSVSYCSLDRWLNTLPWQSDIQTIYDSDTDRLQRYGQRGYAVLKGEDFH